MGFFYELEHILGEDTKTKEHRVNKNAKYEDGSGSPKRIIYKKNKYNDPKFSCFEVALTALASLFLSPHLTPKQNLVKDKNKQIVGLGSEYFTLTAQRRERFVALKEKEAKSGNEQETTEKQAKYRMSSSDATEEIPISLLDEHPPGFFSQLWEDKKQGKLIFDMHSLASVLTTSYTLEEDDLHKGNWGFYLVNKLISGEAKQQVVFFKIDNELMMSDSLMSHHISRVTNWWFDDCAFKVTARDLIAFPKLSDSQNFYWPTSRRYLINPIDNKVYSSPKEILAFTELGADPEFKKAKWREFLKHILIPQEIIEQGLSEAFDREDAYDRAQISQITHAVLARQAKLRAVLFTVPEFRNFVNENFSEITSIPTEILDGVEESQRQRLSNEILNNLHRYYSFCQKSFVEGDTPLHVAIRLGDYRYDESWDAFSEFAEQKNKSGEKPIDIAVAMVNAQNLQEDVRKDPLFIVQSLLNKGVKQTPAYQNIDENKKKEIKKYRFGTAHLNKAKLATSSQELIEVMAQIGEDHSYSLKMKKVLSVTCMKKFIEVYRNNADPKSYEKILLEIKAALHGSKEHPPLSQLQFIRQLRSRLWIIRKIRGFVGGTATQVELDGLINDELYRINNSPLKSDRIDLESSSLNSELDNLKPSFLYPYSPASFFYHYLNSNVPTDCFRESMDDTCQF